MLTMLFQQICDPFALHIFIVMFDHPKKPETGNANKHASKPTNQQTAHILTF